MRKIVFCAMCALALLSCKKGPDVPQGEIVYSVTGDYTNVTQNSVTITCSSIADGFFDVGERGVLYSTNSDATWNNSLKWYSYDNYDKEEYTVTIGGLQPGTKYYYRSFVRIRHEISSSSYYYGEIKSFTTLLDV